MKAGERKGEEQENIKQKANIIVRDLSAEGTANSKTRRKS